MHDPRSISVSVKVASALLCAVALVACKPQAPVEPAADVVPAPAAPTPPAADAAATAAPVAFDAKAFAGTFTGTLPCADCPGIDTRIVLAADGTYTITESYQARSAPELTGDGTWTVEENDQRLRLDPNSKSDRDRLFAILSQDEIRQLDLEGKPIESSLPYNLRRASK
ncbi:MAG TPA: copper resistance protein NlpE [Lysobacter sp.]